MRDKIAISAYLIEKNKKGPIFKATNVRGKDTSVDGVFEILFEIYLH